MRIAAAGATDVGRKRQGNEDSFLIDESIGLYIVCDGMGGHAAGEVASERSIAFAAEYIRKHQRVIRDAKSALGGYSRVVAMVEDAIQYACAKLNGLGQSNQQYRGMGTTMTLLLVVDTKAIMGHVGDSRLYVLRDDNVHQLSTDHTLANELMSTGGMSADSEVVARYHHVLTRVIGTQESVQVETLLFDLFPDDFCLLCSDGLSNYLSDDATIGELQNPKDLQASTRAFIEFANRKGGADNITALAIIAQSDTDAFTNAIDVRERLKLLKSSFLCEGISESRALRLLNISSVVIAPAGQTLVSTSDQDTGVYIVRSGRVLLEQSNRIAVEIPAGQTFGETSLASAGKSNSSVTVIEDAEMLFISRKRFDSLTRRLPKLGRQLYKNLAAEICRLYDNSMSGNSLWMIDTVLEFDDEE